MKKIALSLFLGLMLIGMMGSVIAQDDDSKTFSEPGTYNVHVRDLIDMKGVYVMVSSIGPDERNDSWYQHTGEPQVYLQGGGVGYPIHEGETLNITKNRVTANYPISVTANSINLEDESAEITIKNNLGSNDDEDEDEDEDETDDDNEDNFGLGQTIRGRVKAGIYTSPEGEQIRVSELAQNRFRFRHDNESVEAETELELETETENNQTKLKVKLKNGRNVTIKIMPAVAAQRALERLRLKVCNNDSGCQIELKEVGKGNRTKIAYEVQIERHSRILGIFRKKMEVRAQVDAETGEVIGVKKPWWAFLAAEPSEE